MTASKTSLSAFFGSISPESAAEMKLAIMQRRKRSQEMHEERMKAIAEAFNR